MEQNRLYPVLLTLNLFSLNGYFVGIKALVSPEEHTPEYPNPNFTGAVSMVNIVQPSPVPKPYLPHPDYKSAEYLEKYHAVQECYLNEKSKVAVPDLYAYNGIPQHQPDPAIGSHKLVGLRDDICFDRFGRYGPYGLGYELKDGGTSQALDTESSNSEVVWEKTGKINYGEVNWGKAQAACFEKNKQRFVAVGDSPYDSQFSETSTGLSKLERTAVVIRTYVGFQWTQHTILNFRAMISELSLKSGGEYDVHFLLHVKDDNAPIWSDTDTVQKILKANVPTEFHGLCTLWSEAQMKLYYPGDFGEAVENPSGSDIHGVYRSAHFPLQVFANNHPEYAHFWNWEMDMRFLGSYYELFDRLGAWGDAQPRDHLWERSAKYYIPSLHQTWGNFSDVVRQETERSKRQPIFGPLVFAGRTSLRSEERGEPILPASCATPSDPNYAKICGVGEAADLITLNPIFDAEESGWVFAQDVTGYERVFETPPRRCAIITASRLSRRLLNAMHEETWRLHHGMFSEMFPASMALHHGLKAVYAPHPVYLDRAWQPASSIDRAFNGGRDGSAGGHGSPFDFTNEHNHKGTSWYYNSEFSGLLWRRWLGYGQMDGRGDGGGRNGEGVLRGGKIEEEHPGGTGRLCMRSMLVHPIKWENPLERPE
jgi:hypothetical protein